MSMAYPSSDYILWPATVSSRVLEFLGCCMVEDSGDGTTQNAGTAIMRTSNTDGGANTLAPAAGQNEAVLCKLERPVKTPAGSRLLLPVSAPGNLYNSGNTEVFAYWYCDWSGASGLYLPQVEYTWAIKAILEDFQVSGDDCATWNDYQAMSTAAWSEGMVSHQGDSFTGPAIPQYGEGLAYGLAGPVPGSAPSGLVYGFAVEAVEWSMVPASAAGFTHVRAKHIVDWQTGILRLR
jgi:hypothetical protein